MIKKITTLSFAFGLSSLSLLAQVEKPEPEDTLRKEEGRLPVFSMSTGDLEGDFGAQDVSGLLQSSRDVFTSTAGYNFGSARFRIRGLGSENSTVMINGIRMNSLELGWASWSNWGGLNDITRNMETKVGLVASDYTFGGVLGYSYLNARASAIRKGNRVSYAYSNRSYRHRAMVTTSTGMMKNGLAIAASASRRYAGEGYVEGTFYDSWSYFISLEKKLNEKHSLGFVGFGAPLSRGRSGIVVQEAYDLKDNNYYNPNWGYQEGKKRNAKVVETHLPVLIGSHYWTINDKSKLETSVSYSFGERKSSSLNWFDAKDPRPDYYRYLPSYYELTDRAEYNRLVNAWTQDENFGQINWNDLYQANYKNLYTVENAGGIQGNNVTGNRSKYILENRNINSKIISANSIYKNRINDRMNFAAGTNITSHKSRNYKEIKDLLGGDFWIDIDNMADRDFNDDNLSQNNVENPNTPLKEGDVFGYDYDINMFRTETFAQVEHKAPKFETYAAVMVSTTSFDRYGNMKNGRFPDESKGQGEKHSFFNYGAKGGALYKLTGRNFLSVNASYLTRAPLPRNVYLAPTIRDEVVTNLTSEKIMAFDVNYIMRYSRWKSRVSIYYSSNKDITMLNSYYHDEFQTLVNYSMTGVDQVRMGLELGTEYQFTQTWTGTAVLALGDHRYVSQPLATINRTNSPELIAKDRKVYLKNYKIGGMPQQALSVGVKYSSPKYWFAGANFNYYADINLEPNPDRRTSEAVENLVSSDPGWSEILDQTKLDNHYTVSLFGGKSWRLKGGKYFLSWTLNVNNLLNNRDFATGGFEQLRYDNFNINKFPPKLGYFYGMTYFTMLSLRF
ncbi:MAG: Plug domain-containing protein [Bacteroidetes bacterium]|nr:MAG: Plug domain-containing protein [Bacteroidota bacterium]